MGLVSYCLLYHLIAIFAVMLMSILQMSLQRFNVASVGFLEYKRPRVEHSKGTSTADA